MHLALNIFLLRQPENGSITFWKKIFSVVRWIHSFLYHSCFSFLLPLVRFKGILYKGRVKNANREKAYVLETSLIGNQPARQLSSSQEVTKPLRSCVQCFVARDYIPPLLPFHTQWELYSPRKIVLPSSNNGACRYQTL